MEELSQRGIVHPYTGAGLMIVTMFIISCLKWISSLALDHLIESRKLSIYPEILEKPNFLLLLQLDIPLEKK